MVDEDSALVVCVFFVFESNKWNVAHEYQRGIIRSNFKKSIIAPMEIWGTFPSITSERKKASTPFNGSSIILK